MTKRLLIDASHAEETRVVVLDGNRLEDFDVETLSRRQLKGNIYLAKIVRVEPSLQAAFVEYGGNRHGFLAFGEIHPDYYQIPVADRQRLLEMQEAEARAEENAEEDDSAADAVIEAFDEPPGAGEIANEQLARPLRTVSDTVQGLAEPETGSDATEQSQDTAYRRQEIEDPDFGVDIAPEASEPAQLDSMSTGAQFEVEAGIAQPDPNSPIIARDLAENQEEADPQIYPDSSPDDHPDTSRVRQVSDEDAPAPETLGGDTDGAEEVRPTRQASRFMRSYKIQEVIRRRQILLIQVVKEERGTKGAALTTYISLAGRYCVLMPNSPRGGGISRKITSSADRRRLKEVTTELDIPRGMGLIVRTAGAARPKPEIKRDGEYLLRLWDDIREKTMQSVAPMLIHEEASLIKRAIRDVYSRDVDELLVDGEDGWRSARDYMRMLMPTHVRKVQLWPGNAQPLFAHSQVESMLDAMLDPVVQLRSGGYLVINQTEALVAIDVNSGRSTRERGIEETALRTNLEAAEEAARQLRLRDLAGLIVIDFIDMESKKHNSMVERRMADALRQDRARIQIGHISHFGLLELSRQRLRPSLAETSLNVCSACGGTGHVRSTESAALHVLREIEEEGGRRRASQIQVHVAGSTALYILNNKRQRLTEIETRYGMQVCFAADDTLLPAQTRIEKLRAATAQDLPALPTPMARVMPDDDAAEASVDDDADDVIMDQTGVEAVTLDSSTSGDFTTDVDHVPGETAAEGEQRRKRRRRRRRGSRREETPATDASVPALIPTDQPDLPDLHVIESMSPPDHVAADDGASEMANTAALPPFQPISIAPEGSDSDMALEVARAKRGRRGGRRRRKVGEDVEASTSSDIVAAAPVFDVYVGPTPADPFAMSGVDIFEALEAAEFRPIPSMIDETTSPDGDQPDLVVSEPVVFGTSTMAPVEQDVSSTSVREPLAGEAVRPVVITGAEAIEKKKGWWRR